METKFCYNKHKEDDYHQLELHTLLLNPGQNIRFCKTEIDAQDCTNYYFNKLGIRTSYIPTDYEPAMYAYSNPTGINFILFDPKTDLILNPIDRKELDHYFQ